MSSRGTRVQVFIGETDQVGHVPRYQAILEYLRKEGAAGATVVRGVAGFGANSRIHTAAILRLSLDLPMILTWIDAPERVQRLLPGLTALAGSGIVTVEQVEIVAYGGRRLDQLRFDLPIEDVINSDPVSVGASASVLDAVRRMIEHDFRALPVVDDQGLLVGMLTSGDLVARAGLGARVDLVSALDDAARTAILGRLPERAVREVMTKDPVAIRRGRTLAEAARVMAERTLKRLPVIDDAGALIGIVSRADVLHAVGETFPKDEVGGAHPGAVTLDEIMRTDAPVVREDADLAALLDAVASTRLNRAIVVDAGGGVLGVVSDAEVLRAIDPAGTAGLIGALMRTAGRAPGANLRAGDVPARRPLTLPPETTISEAARQMIEQRYKVLCVTDRRGKLLGIVDRADLLRATGGALAQLAEDLQEQDDDEA